MQIKSLKIKSVNYKCKNVNYKKPIYMQGTFGYNCIQTNKIHETAISFFKTLYLQWFTLSLNVPFIW